jgi:hypothetical protein
MKGCKYNQRFKLCQPSNDGSMSAECELLDGRCLTNEEYEKKVGTPPVKQVIIPPITVVPTIAAPITVFPTIVSEELSPEIMINDLMEHVDYLSGPVSWYNFNGKIGNHVRTFNFFGDKHFSKDGTCSDAPNNKKCLTVGPNLKLPNEDSQDRCYDITYILAKLFEDSNKNKIYADFFLEFPFRKGTEHHLDKLVKSLTTKPSVENITQFSKLDYISSLYVIFHDCLQVNKKDCKYSPYVRFHYSDIRLTEKHTPLTINSYLFVKTTELVSEIVNYCAHYDMIDLGIFGVTKEELLKDIKDKGSFLEELYLNLTTVGKTTSGIVKDYNKRIFEAFLFSDNFQSDIFAIMNELTPCDAKYKEQCSIFDDFIQEVSGQYVTRNNKKISKLRAQLIGLRNDNVIQSGVNMADLVERFLLDEYNKIDLVTTYNFFNTFKTKILVPFRNIRSSNDVTNVLMNIKDVSKTLINAANLIISDALLMDGYILGRMFRTFKGSNQHLVSQDVYTYTGAEHTETYVRFFTKYLGMNIKNFRGSKKGDRCLKLKI